MTKIHELRLLVDKKCFDIIGITESWCNEKIVDAEIHLSGYNLYRTDRKHGKGGGVLLYVRDKIKCISCEKLNGMEFDESHWAIITLENRRKILIGIVYKSTGSTNINNENLLKLLMQTSKVANIDRTIIMGDFNFPELNFEWGLVDGSNDSWAAKFFDCVQNLDLI